MSMIQANNICRSFGKGNLQTNVLRNISLTVESGEFLAIMGKSGAGKSTLMYQLSILDIPTTGDIFINDINTTELDEQERTIFRLNNLGYIFQNYSLVPDLSAVENVMLPLLMRGTEWYRAREIAIDVIEKVGIKDKYKNLPSELSGGEQQRISIARAIAGNPKILFADEPTANLDSVSGGQIINLITELNKNGQTVVMVTHEPEYAVNCDRIIHLEDGEIIRTEKLDKQLTYFN